MGKNKRKQIWEIIVLGLAILLVAGGIWVWMLPEPPRDEMKLAREALLSAQKAGAEVYAPSFYKQAQQLYDSAMVCWGNENEHFFLNRDYSKVCSFVALVIEKANEARQKSCQQQINTNSFVKNGITGLEQKVQLYEQVYKRMPLPGSVIGAHNKGKMKLAEARIAFEGDRFNEAKQHYQKAVELINSSNNKAEEILTVWFIHFPLWKKHGDEAIHLSRGGKKVILIDKYAHQCVVLQSGKPIRYFDVELGTNWMGDKRKKGDKTTPEGVYRITQVKEGARTNFHKALLINYPNDEDKRRLAAEKRKGTLALPADIGGLIEIHGHGGKGVDWTDGCVALKNEDMDVICRLVSTGVPVIIVGSLKPLNDIYEKISDKK